MKRLRKAKSREDGQDVDDFLAGRAVFGLQADSLPPELEAELQGQKRDAAEKATIEDMSEALAALSQEDAQVLREDGLALSASMGPDSVLHVPAGWLLCERTAKTSCHGIRRVVFSKHLENINQVRGKPSPVAQTLLSLL